VSVSYADAIRSHVYTNTSDTLLTYFGEAHPGQEFYIGIARTMAWNLLTGVVDSCDASTVERYVQPEALYGFPLPMRTSKLKTSQVQSAWSTSVREKQKYCEAGGFTKRHALTNGWLPGSKRKLRSRLQKSCRES
jgi:hypothetical protein